MALAILLSCAAASFAGAPPARAGTPHPIGADFNGDGYGDVAIGVSGETVNGKEYAGAVHVLYGSKQGLRTDNEQFLTAASPGIVGDPIALDDFGYALAHGDLNGDGYDDLAIGMPYHDTSQSGDAGGVHVLYGSPSGLGNDRLIDQSTPGVPGNLGVHHFGEALAIGDFDGDGVDDLAVGAPDDAPHGTVTVFRGTQVGQQLVATAYFPSLDGDKQFGFGTRLAAGDFDGDGKDELAIDQPLDPVNNVKNAGRVWVVRVSSTQVSLEVALDHSNLPGDVQAYGEFGYGGIAAGHIGDDKYDELAVGTSAYDVGGVNEAGQVVVVRGGPNGLDPTKAKEIVNGANGVPGQPTAGAYFGASVAIGDANGDGRGDLAVGENPYGDPEPTSVVVLFGGQYNVSTNNAKLLTEKSLGVTTQVGSSFGAAVHWTDANDDGTASLLIGAPLKNVGGIAGGTVTVVPGSATFPPGASSVKVISEATAGIADAPALDDGFGETLT